MDTVQWVGICIALVLCLLSVAEFTAAYKLTKRAKRVWNNRCETDMDEKIEMKKTFGYGGILLAAVILEFVLEVYKKLP